MNDFLKMDIFFLITTAATVVFTVLGTILLVYLIGLMRDLKYISKKARQETEKISEDIDRFRQNIRERGFGLLSVTNFLKSIHSRFKKGKKNGK